MRIAPLLFAASLAGVPAIGQNAGTAPTARMAADAHPSFVVASIHLHDPNSACRGCQGFSTQGDRMLIRNESVADIIQVAYSMHARQIADAPDWVFQDRYDIEGKWDVPGDPNLPQQQGMLKHLLADRFGFKFHRDKRELAVFAIQVAKGGPKLKPAANPDAGSDEQGDNHGTERAVTYTSASIADFIRNEQFDLERPLVDQTGLTGRYDFTLRYTYDESRATDAKAAPGLFTAIQEQLGLKLQPVKAPVDVLVIDAVHKPSEN